MQRQANTFLTLHTALFTFHTCTSHLHFISTHLIWALLISFHVLRKTRCSTTLYYKACTNYFPVLLCSTKHAQSTSQYYLGPQSLHKALPSTTLYYKACTNYFPVLLCTTIQSLHKARPSTTLYYKACTNYFPVLLCTIIQSLHKARPSTTLYCKACTKHVPVENLLTNPCRSLDAATPILFTRSSHATGKENC